MFKVETIKNREKAVHRRRKSYATCMLSLLLDIKLANNILLHRKWRHYPSSVHYKSQIVVISSGEGFIARTFLIVSLYNLVLYIIFNPMTSLPVQ